MRRRQGLDTFKHRHRFISSIHRIGVSETLNRLERSRRTEPIDPKQSSDEGGPDRRAERILVGSVIEVATAPWADGRTIIEMDGVATPEGRAALKA